MFLSKKHPLNKAALEFLRYIGPGILVTVGFIDPGNWASNIAAGSTFGYSLLWMVTLSTFMLIFLQHNAAHLGIVTGKCLSEAVTENLRPWVRNIILWSAMAAAVSTAMAELLGCAIALSMLFGISIKIGAVIVLLSALLMQLTNSYRKIEKIIIGFVSVVGLSFLFEISIVHVDWGPAALGWVMPSFPKNSMPIIMSVLGAVVMPHNLYLHSEIIQSRQWHLEDKEVIQKQLKYEYMDTLFSMILGWMINSAMIILAAATFFQTNTAVTELGQAQLILKPMVGNAAAIIFAMALLLSGLSSSITAGMAGGSIFAGLYSEPYDIKDSHTKTGVLITMVLAALTIFFIASPFSGLVYSQMLLSIQLPITIFAQVALTSSKKVMGEHANSRRNKIALYSIAAIVTALNMALLLSYILG